MMLFNILYRLSSFKNEVNIQQKNSTLKSNSIFNEKFNAQLVKSALLKIQCSMKYFNI